MMHRKKAPAARKSKGGRAKVPLATARLSVSLEKDLLTQAQAFARAHRTTVPELVAEGLRKVVGAEKLPVLPPTDVQSNPAPESGPWAQLLAWMEEQQTTLTEIRNALGDVAASLPNDAPPDVGRGSRSKIPPP
jgi:hypothetical protein